MKYKPFPSLIIKIIYKKARAVFARNIQYFFVYDVRTN